MIILMICNAIPHLRSTLLRTSAAPPAPLHEVLSTSEPLKMMILLQSLHLLWTEYFAEFFTGIKKGAHSKIALPGEFKVSFGESVPPKGVPSPVG